MEMGDAAATKGKVNPNVRTMLERVKKLNALMANASGVKDVLREDVVETRQGISRVCSRLLSDADYAKSALEQHWTACHYEPLRLIRSASLNSSDADWTRVFLQCASGFYHSLLAQHAQSQLAYQMFIYLGDLSRYRHLLWSEKRDLVLAQHYYTTACDLDPALGLALNQLALLCQSSQPFRAVQLFLAAKLAPRPFARAGDNLRAVLKMKEASSLRTIDSIILRISQLFLLNFSVRASDLAQQELRDALSRSLLDPECLSHLPSSLSVMSLLSRFVHSQDESLEMKTSSLHCNLEWIVIVLQRLSVWESQGHLSTRERVAISRRRRASNSSSSSSAHSTHGDDVLELPDSDQEVGDGVERGKWLPIFALVTDWIEHFVDEVAHSQQAESIWSILTTIWNNMLAQISAGGPSSRDGEWLGFALFLAANGSRQIDEEQIWPFIVHSSLAIAQSELCPISYREYFRYSTPKSAATSSGDPLSGREGLMKNMARLRMQHDTHEHEKEAWIPVYLLPTVEVLLNRLAELQELIARKTTPFSVVIAHDVMATIDTRKKDTLAARDALRWMYAQVKEARVRIVADRESLVECARALLPVAAGATTSTFVTILTDSKIATEQVQSQLQSQVKRLAMRERNKGGQMSHE